MACSAAKIAVKDEMSQYAASVYRSTRDGAQSALGDRNFRVETRQLGEVVLPSGRLAACDPWVGSDAARRFTRIVEPGRYPVEVDVAVLEDNGDQRVAAAVVRITQGQPVSWEPGLDDGERRAPRSSTTFPVTQWTAAPGALRAPRR